MTKSFNVEIIKRYQNTICLESQIISTRKEELVFLLVDCFNFKFNIPFLTNCLLLHLNGSKKYDYSFGTTTRKYLAKLSFDSDLLKIIVFNYLDIYILFLGRHVYLYL